MVWLARTDKEAAWPPSGQAGPGLQSIDWRYDPPIAVARFLQGAVATMDHRMRWIREPQSRLRIYDLIAVSRLRWGRRILSAGRVVITDRFHGYLLSLLLGIPHVLLDTRFGKLRAFHETWSLNCGLTHWASSPQEALAIAGVLAASQAGQRSRL
jgi:pyruvyl transferase EpsO